MVGEKSVREEQNGNFDEGTKTFFELKVEMLFPSLLYSPEWLVHSSSFVCKVSQLKKRKEKKIAPSHKIRLL